MNDLLDKLTLASLASRIPETVVFALAVDFAITGLHSLQEWKGRGGPLWRNFGAIAGVCLPPWLGFLGFTAGLTLALWALALAGIAGSLPIVGALDRPASTFALGALLGARVSDTAISHIRLHLLGYRPNPGLTSTALYVVEAALLGVAFQTELAARPMVAAGGFIVATLAFMSVLPTLRLLGRLVPAWRRAPWTRWQAMPSWAAA